MTIDELKRIIDRYWKWALYSERIDELLTEFYFAYAERLALAAEPEAEAV